MDLQANVDEPVANPEHRLSFAGSGREYFGIWIVNILLTIVTLGIYSAWAKVRRMRYFYGNTMLMERGFEYHARPLQILIGRIVVFAFLALYNAALNFIPVYGLAIGLPAFLLAMPWFIMRGLRFRARVTSYRNVRFNFTGGYWGALKAFVLGGILSFVSLGIFLPVASRWTWKYVTGNLHYGGRDFAADPRLKAMYQVWGLAAAILFAALIIFIGVAALSSGLLMQLFQGDFDTDDIPVGIIAIIYLSTFVLLIAYGIAGLFYSAGIRNVVMTATAFDGRHRLVSDMPRFRYTWIAITNLVATILTFGLLRPWAAVRLHRYVVEHTALVADGPIEAYMSEIEDEGGAAGAEFMDVEGIDIGF